MTRAFALVLVFAACGGGNAEPTQKTKKNPFGDRAKPASDDDDDGERSCKIKVDDTGFFVDAERIDVGRVRGKRKDDDAVAQLRLSDGSTLVTDRDGQTLWWVDCSRKKPVKKVVSSKDAAITSGEVTPDGTAFVFQDGPKLQALDFDSHELRTIYTTKQEPQKGCSAHKDSGALVPEDSFKGFAEEGRHIVLHRSMLCQWPDTHEVHLVKWSDPGRVVEHPAHVIYALAADAKNTLWMADGGGLWRSDDKGESWKAVPIKLPKQPDVADIGAPVQIYADGAKPGLLVVRTSIVSGIVQGNSGASFPGLVLRTKDAGATWQRVKTPDDRLAADLVVLGGIADDLAIPGKLAGDDATDEDEELPEEPNRAEHLPVAKVKDGARTFPRREAPVDAKPAPKGWLRSRDGGAKWAKSSAPKRETSPVTIGEDTFEATRDGVYVTRDGLRQRLTKALDKPYPRDLF